MSNFDDVTEKQASDSVSLVGKEGIPFTIVDVADSAYEKDGVKTPGVKITTKESWENANGEKVNKLHTTRRAIVNKLRKTDDKDNETNQKLHDALEKGETFKVVVPKDKVKPKGNGMAYFDLIAAE